ncbi:MAG: enoyl-CoA hydratase/isomerase family protein [Betaproteobacteria bacterium]|nr:enoyl-CoA hydratase/isomerase family protein [Betaproteobacteria bacterium]
MAKEELTSTRREPVFPANALTERVIAEKQGAIGWITFNNPARRNAMSVDMWEAIPKVLDRFEADAQVRVVVLCGAGDKAFVSGADISQFEAQRSGAEAVQRYEDICEGAQVRLQESDKPVIAMIQGFCLGAGINIALASDLRIAADDARFGIPAAKMGIGYRVSSTKNLVDTVGAANAREVLLTARQFSAEEAKAMGLVHRVTPAAELEALVAEYCSAISTNAPLTMRTAKRIIRELLKSPAGFDAESCTALVKQCFESADYVEGRRAFMEKRRPVFDGK